jgi:hypothetical protein
MNIFGQLIVEEVQEFIDAEMKRKKKKKEKDILQKLSLIMQNSTEYAQAIMWLNGIMHKVNFTYNLLPA